MDGEGTFIAVGAHIDQPDTPSHSSPVQEGSNARAPIGCPA
jgi:hypothetical protein